MPRHAFRGSFPILVLTLAVAGGGAGATLLHAQNLERRAVPGATPQQPPRDIVARDVDAARTRETLTELLTKHPPAVARVLKLDPSLIDNEGYIAAYPVLRDFFAQHPEIRQNAPYYFERVFEAGLRPENRRLDLVEGTLAGLAGFIALVIVLGTLTWLVKTVLDQRRWSRLSRIQAEVHSKLMDRFSSNDELMTYVQTPSGRRFLESGPSPLAEGAPAVTAPFSRILWSVQIGVVLLVAGAGLFYVSTETLEEAREFFFISGSLGVALGAGFVVSAAASYALSRKLGLFDRPTADHA
jgi:hypothetical protein